jgi:hypothetical protein
MRGGLGFYTSITNSNLHLIHIKALIETVYIHFLFYTKHSYQLSCESYGLVYVFAFAIHSLLADTQKSESKYI